MGIVIDCTCGDSTCRMTPSMTDLEILEAVAADTVTSILPSEWGVPTKRQRTDVLSAVQRIIEEMERPGSLAARVYAFTMPGYPGSDLITTGSGCAGGIQINGQCWAIVAGVGKCFLERCELDDQGQGKVAEVRDLRSEKSVHTDNYGEIKIRTRRRQTRLLRDLRDLENFLQQCASDTVELTMA